MVPSLLIAVKKMSPLPKFELPLPLSVPAPLTLTVPGGKVEIDAIEVGTVFWDGGKVTVDAVGLKGNPRVIGGQLIGGSLP